MTGTKPNGDKMKWSQANKYLFGTHRHAKLAKTALQNAIDYAEEASTTTLEDANDEYYHALTVEGAGTCADAARREWIFAVISLLLWVQGGK